MDRRPTESGQDANPAKPSADLGTLLAAVPDALLAIGPTGSIVHANARCEQLLGYDDGELVGQAVEALIPHALHTDPDIQRDGHPGQSSVGEMGRLDLLALRSDGSKLPVEVSLAPLETDGGSLVLATIRDVSRSRRDELLFRRFLEAAPDAVVVVDERGRMLVVNEQVEVLFGYDRSELLGDSVERLVPEGFAGMHADFRATYAENPRRRATGVAGGLYGKRKDGREFPVEVSLSPLVTDEGLLVLADVRDITDRLEAAAAMQAAEERQQLQREADRIKDEFLAMVSHELRTPLASILGYTELILDHEGLDDGLERFVAVIMRNARRELRLVDDLLMLSSIDKDGMSIQAREVDLGALVREAVESVRPQADAAGLTLETDLPEKTVVVACDPDRIGQALDSLLSNALKFTPRGGDVGVRLRATPATARIEVSDSGSGIGEPEPHRIFERLHRSPTAVADEVPGAGLGLSIAAAIVEAHRGTIRVLHSDETGSTFELQIPVAP
jgi:PAS domain S-box-containing protein